MGHGSYRASDWEKLRNSKGITASSNVSQIFSQNTFNEKYDPKFIARRESRDSEDSPNATPIILAFDVTGSMGHLAEEIAKNSLNKTAVELYDKKPIPNPHIMCAAITSPVSPGGLQVTQFEADIRVVEQLLELKVNFGGNRYSFDSLVWYFASRHTDTDCYNKHKRKGYIITIGDEICGAERGEELVPHEIQNVFNDTVDAPIKLYDLYKEASEKYEIFHIVVDCESSLYSWSRFLPGRCCYLSRVNLLSETIISILQIHSGMDRASVINQWKQEDRAEIANAVNDISFENHTTKRSFFDIIANLFKK